MNPAPLLPPDVDLRDYPYMPVDIIRLFNSDFHARSSDGEWRAGATLWFKSFHQVPAGSIPDVDIALARLAEYGRDAAGWAEVKAGALHGWTLCDDGRWYHKVVCEKALEAWIGKLLLRRSGAVGNAKRWKIEADVSSIDRQLDEAAAALLKLSPMSPVHKKWRPGQSQESAASMSPPDTMQPTDASHPDPNPIAPQSPSDHDPIGDRSPPDRKREGEGEREIERESRASALPLSDLDEGSKPTGKRGRSPKDKIPWPSDFELTPLLREYAGKHGFDPDWLFEKFHNKALSLGWVYRDWSAAFRNFAQNEQNYTPASRSNGAHQARAWRPPDV